MRTLFIGGYGHHYLVPAAKDGRLDPVGWASDGIDGRASQQRASQRLGVDAPPWFDDYRKAMDALKPEVVNIGGVYARQGPIAAEAIERGCKVVCEKPIAGDPADLAKIEQAVAAAGEAAVLLTEFDLRSRPEFRAAREAVRRGMVGEPVLVTAQKSYRFGDARPEFYKRREDYGGTLLWVASHGIDVAWFASGKPFASVTGTGGNVARTDYGEMEDHVAVCYTLSGGGSAMIHADFLRPGAAPTHGDDRLRLVGSRGQIEVRGGRCELITQDEGVQDITDMGGKIDVTSELIAALQGDRSVYCTNCSLYMAKVLLASRDAVDTGQWVELPGARPC